MQNLIKKSKWHKNPSEYKRIFAELESSYRRKKKAFKDNYLPCGWTWWSLPSKNWRVAKTLGFENDEFNHEWVFYNTVSGSGSYSISRTAQEGALVAMREKYPDNVLLQNISSGGRLD